MFINDRRDWVISALASHEEGRRLLDLAEQTSTKIVGKDKGIFGDKGLYKGAKKDNPACIELNVRLSPKKLVFALAHELYHVEQNTHVPFKDEKRYLSNKDRVLINRLYEGDANARAALLITRINEQHKLNLPADFKNLFSFPGLTVLQNTMQRLLKYKSSDEKILRTTFRNFQLQAMIGVPNYDSDFHAKKSPVAEKRKGLYSETFNKLSHTTSAGRPGFSYFKGHTTNADFFRKLTDYVPPWYS